ncbi:MAG TPA: hypothetical protein VJQ47_17450 [Steroidobacteraceae bacterium]|nr:hypothetical protein [Steroidobacteraceae bacterium]
MPRWGPGLLACAALVLNTAIAGDPAPQGNDPADADLLEFLGTLDAGDESSAAADGSWIDYLARTDIAKVAKTTDSPAKAGTKPDAAKPSGPAGVQNND